MSAVRKLSEVTPSPESDLRRLFTEEDQALALVARIHGQQKVARAAYAKAHGLLLLPSMRKLREVLGS